MKEINLTVCSQLHYSKTQIEKEMGFLNVAHAIQTVNTLNRNAVLHGITYWINIEQLDAAIKAEAEQVRKENRNEN